MTHTYSRTEQLRGARIHLSELAGLEIRDCEVSGLKIVDCYGNSVYIGGEFGRLVVNDVDVTDYVEAELDRRHPVRVLARDATSVDDYRAAWGITSSGEGSPSALSRTWTTTANTTCSPTFSPAGTAGT